MRVDCRVSRTFLKEASTENLAQVDVKCAKQARSVRMFRMRRCRETAEDWGIRSTFILSSVFESALPKGFACDISKAISKGNFYFVAKIYFNGGFCLFVSAK